MKQAPWPRPDSIDREDWRISAVGVIFFVASVAWFVWAFSE